MFWAQCEPGYYSCNKDDQLTWALGVCRKVVSTFSTRWKKRRELKKVQVEKDLPQHNLIADWQTRWGFMEAMVSRLLEQDDAVRVVLSSDRKSSHFVLTWQDIHVMESLSKVLSHVAELTDFLSGEKHVTVSSFYSFFTTLLWKFFSKMMTLSCQKA